MSAATAQNGEQVKAEPAQGPTAANGQHSDNDSDSNDEGAAEDASIANGDPSASSSSKMKKKKKKKKKTSTAAAASSSSTHPVSHVDSSLPIPPGVEQHYFDPVKGKGLIATRDFKEGDVVFEDEAFVAAPPMAQAKKVETGQLCNACFLPVDGAGVGLNVGCKAKGCGAVWCNRECEQRGRSQHHNIMCKGSNPAIEPFLFFLSTHPYLSIHSVARLYSRILLSHSPTPPPSLTKTSSTSTLQETLSHASAFATISELIRRRRNPGWEVEKKAFTDLNTEALRLLKIGMDPYSPERLEKGEQGGIRGKGKWLVNPDFPRDVAQQIFSWDGFMRALGRANLNMEAQGSMYAIHSHLNHSCEPNLNARHPPNRRGIRQATRLHLVANRAITKGEELFITYQDPSVSLRRRNLLLWREHIFGPCSCPRCEREMAEISDVEERERILKFEPTKEDEDEVKVRRKHAMTLEKEQEARGLGKDGEKDLSGLEEELRETLGF